MDLGIYYRCGLCGVLNLDYYGTVPLVENFPYAQLGLGNYWSRIHYFSRAIIYSLSFRMGILADPMY